MVGVSAGGLEAVSTLLRGLPADFGMAMVVVQHRSRDSTALCDLLQDASALPVHEVMDKDPIVPGQVYLAPPDYHLLVEDGHFALSCEEPQLFSRPSIDLAFESAADSHGRAVVGVILTGANSDGSRGLRSVQDAGGLAIVQSPATAEVPTMPAAAQRAVPEAESLRLEDLAARLSELAAEEAHR